MISVAKMGVSVLAAFLLASVLASCAVPSTKKAGASQAAAWGLLGEGRWADAETEFTRVNDAVYAFRREIKASEIDCKWLSSWCEFNEQEAESIRANLERDLARSFAGRAVVRYELHDYNGANSDAEAALERMPENGLARYVLIRGYDRTGNMKGVQKEIARLDSSPDQFSRNMGRLIRGHYQYPRDADWALTVNEIRKFTREQAAAQGWGAMKLRAAVAEPANMAFTFEVTVPPGWEQLGGANAVFVDQTVKRVNPVRDYDDVGVSVTAGAMKLLLPDEKPDVRQYRDAYIKGLRLSGYDTTTVRPFPALEQPGRQTAFWIDGIKYPSRELVVLRSQGPYVVILAMIVMRDHDTLTQRYLPDVQKMISSVSIDRVRLMSLSDRLKAGKPLSEFDRYRARQEAHFSVHIDTPRGWNSSPSFDEGKWNTQLGVAGDIGTSGALRILMLNKEFGYPAAGSNDVWSLVASKFGGNGDTPLPLKVLSSIRLPPGWQARVSDMPYDPGRSLLFVKRHGDYLLVYSFTFLRSVTYNGNKTPADIEQAVRRNEALQKYLKDIEYMLTHTTFATR